MNAINRASRLTIGLAGLGFLGACTSLPVTTDSNPSASVSICHTYMFAQEHSAAPGQTGGAYGNPLNSDRLRAGPIGHRQALNCGSTFRAPRRAVP